ncbi:MAG: hypothetical protein IH973_14655 [Myxococcales bacterium]|nr:hypothetical protein [Myxococcales bacterium]
MSAEPPRKLPAPATEAAPKTKPAPKLSKAERTAQRERRKAHDKVQRKIQRIEKLIEQEERSLEALGWKLGDPKIASDATQLQELQAERVAVQQLIEEQYRDWERLSDELSALADGLA